MKKFLCALLFPITLIGCGSQDTAQEQGPPPEVAQVAGVYTADVTVEDGAGDIISEYSGVMTLGQVSNAVYWWGLTGIALSDRVVFDYCIEVTANKQWTHHARHCFGGEHLVEKGRAMVSMKSTYYEQGEKVGVEKYTWRIKNIEPLENPHE